MADLNEVIPTIDLKNIPDEKLNQQIREASERWGCFKVINHGVSSSLLSEIKKTVIDFHERPHEVKIRNTKVMLSSGYRPRSDVNPYYESFGLFDIASPQAINTFCDKLKASTEQREIMVKYGKAMDGLAKYLTRMLAKSYELEDPDICKEWPSKFRTSKYHFGPESVGKNGLVIHTDPGFLTILQGDDDVGGLEAMDHSSGTFFPIHMSPNTLTVNLGDMAKIWSNGRLCSVKHRVQCKEPKMRITIATFLFIPRDEIVEPPSKLVDAEHPRLYKPVSYGELRKIRLSKNMYDGETLQFVTLK